MAYHHGADFLDRIQRYLKPGWDKEEWLVRVALACEQAIFYYFTSELLTIST